MVTTRNSYQATMHKVAALKKKRKKEEQVHPRTAHTHTSLMHNRIESSLISFMYIVLDRGGGDGGLSFVSSSGSLSIFLLQICQIAMNYAWMPSPSSSFRVRIDA